MVDGVLLDWEGVLADTGPARRDALLRALADEGLHFDATAYDECCPGLSLQEAASAAVGRTVSDPTLVDLVALRARREFAARLAQGFALQPGAARMIELAQLRAPIAIVTAADRPATETALRLAGFLDSCAAIVTADDVKEEAPARAHVELALEHLARRRSLRREHVIALAATRGSIRAARAAGVRTVAVGAPAHVALEADAAIASLHDLDLDELAALAGVQSERHA
jgi:beta-phosphoglucomutase-like phosphatase (HAD superfamily)